ncbi:MAG TPA: hypothetical protein DEP47_05490 [Chloroflexi bacterium]|nr:hypothetical protein [Chloroflexota bacterium]
MVGKVTPDTMLSASRLPAVMGYSKYRSPNDELKSSIDAINGKERPDISNEAMGWGNRLEKIILNEAAQRLVGTDAETDFPEAFFHKDIPICCSLDGRVDGGGKVISTDPDKGIYIIGMDSLTLDGPGCLESKLTKNLPEDAPALYRGPIQLQAQMDILGHKWGAVCVLYQGIEMRVFVYARHEPTVNAIHKTALGFQGKLNQYKESGEVTMYPAQNSKDADRMFPDINDVPPINLPDFAAELAEKLIDTKAALLELENNRTKWEGQLKEMMGEKPLAIAGKWQIKWGVRNFKAQPERIVPAKPAYTIRQSNLTIKESK